MSERIIYLNGDYLAESEAKLPVFDRGLLFADAVYEGFGILDGQIGDFGGNKYHPNRWRGARMVASECNGEIIAF